MRVLPLLPVVTALLLGPAAGPAVAAAPTIERIAVNDTFEDQFLADACGLDSVTTQVKGRITLRTFPAGKGQTELVTLNLAVTATADGNTVRFRDVGSDSTRVLRDGTVVLSLRGQAPFQFTGIMKINLTTDEVILESPQRRTDAQAARICAALRG